MLTRIKNAIVKPFRSKTFVFVFRIAAAVILTGVFVFELFNSTIRTVKIIDDGSVLKVATIYSDPYQILRLAGRPVEKYDVVTMSNDNDEINVKRAFPVKVVMANDTYTAKAVVGSTVADALKFVNISVDSDDIVEPALNVTVDKDTIVTVTKIEYKTISEYEQVTSLHQLVHTYDIKLVNGEETERKETSVAPVMGENGAVISTLSPLSTIELDANGKPVKYKELMVGQSTAYCCGTTCATGVKVRPGYIAVNPKIIPYGTKMYIVSCDGKYTYGYAIAADTGGFAKKNRQLTDLYMYDYDDCIKFGRRNVEIYILD